MFLDGEQIGKLFSQRLEIVTNPYDYTRLGRMRIAAEWLEDERGDPRGFPELATLRDLCVDPNVGTAPATPAASIDPTPRKLERSPILAQPAVRDTPARVANRASPSLHDQRLQTRRALRSQVRGGRWVELRAQRSIASARCFRRSTRRPLKEQLV